MSRRLNMANKVILTKVGVLIGDAAERVKLFRNLHFREVPPLKVWLPQGSSGSRGRQCVAARFACVP